jgi:hypothetical protein
MHVRRDETLRLRTDPHGVRIGEDRQSRRERRGCADDVVPARAFVQASCDDRADVQARLDAQLHVHGALDRLQRADARMQFERCANRPQVVVFVGGRYAEQ